MDGEIEGVRDGGISSSGLGNGLCSVSWEGGVGVVEGECEGDELVGVSSSSSWSSSLPLCLSLSTSP